MAQREVPGQEGYEVFRYADGPDAGTAVTLTDWLAPTL